MKKGIVSMLLAIALVLSVLPVTAMAAESYAYPTSQPTLTWEGSGTPENPYVIDTAQELADLAWMINNGKTDYVSACYKLGGDIDLSGGTWTPIGGSISAKTFKGTFDGNGCTISGLNDVKPVAAIYAGLFSRISGADTKIKNLTVSGEYTTSATNCAGVCAYASSGTFEGCVSHVNITCTYASTDAVYIGGIVGYGDSDIILSKCTNEGNVSYSGGKSSANYGVGGIVGYVDGSSTASKIEDCINYGEICGTANLGGILGCTNNVNLLVTGCGNQGAVTGSGNAVAGICGIRKNAIVDCYNTANITGNSEVGGICGKNAGNNVAIKNSYNTGNITGKSTSTYIYVGGIEGYTDGAYKNTTSLIENCYNTGAVSGYSDSKSNFVGGISGMITDGAITSCHSYGTVSNAKAPSGMDYYSGAIAGGKGTVENCYYLNGTDLKATQKTAEEFADGTVAKLLQAGNTEEVWGQTIGTDLYPVFYNGSNSLMPAAYTVTWLVDGVEYYKTEGLKEGDAIVAPADPAKEAAECTTYIFEKWTPDIPETMPAQDLTFEASFTENTEHKLDYTDNGDGTHSAACACGEKAITGEAHDYYSDPEHKHFCVCGAENPVYIYAASLSLAGNIGVNFYTHVDETVVEAGNAYMRFITPRGGTVEIPVSQIEPKDIGGEIYYIFTATVAAKEMTDVIQVQFFYGEKMTPVCEYTAAQYLDAAITNENHDPVLEDFKPVAEALKVYGAWAQRNFGYNTDDLPMDAPALEDITATDLAAYQVTQKQGTEKVSLYAASLIMKTETSLRLFFNCNTSDLTVTRGGEALEVTQVAGSDLCYVTISSICATDLDEWFTVTINDGTETAEITCSPMTYCYNVLAAQAGTFTDELINTVKALYLYAMAANAFFA